MYCDTPQTNQLTALLIAHGICDIVVCPGSRNGTIVHNLHEAGQHFRLHPVTDERSAAFVALGIALARRRPSAVCVTSGSALLGCLPAVAEAYYRQLPLLVISADRPPHCINQLDGQTLPQNGALLPYCATMQLTEPHTAAEALHNNRLINEALLSLGRNGGRPAHINVPVSEPMFRFHTPQLPDERVIREYHPAPAAPLPEELTEAIRSARLPALLIGQYEGSDLREVTTSLDRSHRMLVLPEIISDVPGSLRMNAFDSLDENETALLPDVIVQIGGNFIHKRFKQLLRNTGCRVVRIGQEDYLPDTFGHLTAVVRSSALPALEQLADTIRPDNEAVRHAQEHLDAAAKARRADLQQALCTDSGLSLPGAVELLRRSLEDFDAPFTFHLANSSAVRAAARIFPSGGCTFYCNRGVNGIEGSLSTAVGFALNRTELQFVLIGDLSFFYDVNVLGAAGLPANLRILLLNNGHGAIFDSLPGLSASPARDEYIAGGSRTVSAEGIAAAYDVQYQAVSDKPRLEKALKDWLLPSHTARFIEVRLP